MKRFLLVAAAAALLASPASANVIYTLSNATLVGGGQLTGSITVTDDLAHLVDLSITAPAIGGYASVTYNFSDTVSFQLPLNGYIRVDKGPDELQLAFPVLDATGATFYAGGQSYESQPNPGFRLVTGGSFVVAAAPAPAPEPATWTLALAGLGLIGFGLNRRRTLSRTA